MTHADIFKPSSLYMRVLSWKLKTIDMRFCIFLVPFSQRPFAFEGLRSRWEDICFVNLLATLAKKISASLIIKTSQPKRNICPVEVIRFYIYRK